MYVVSARGHGHAGGGGDNQRAPSRGRKPWGGDNQPTASAITFNLRPECESHDLPPDRVARLGGASAVDHHVRRVHARVVAPPPAQVAAHLPARGRKRQGRRFLVPRWPLSGAFAASRARRGGPEPHLCPRAPRLCVARGRGGEAPALPRRRLRWTRGPAAAGPRAGTGCTSRRSRHCRSPTADRWRCCRRRSAAEAYLPRGDAWARRTCG